MDFVILSTADWDNPFWTNKQHVAQELALKGHKVIYINSLGLRQPSVNASDLGRIFRRLKQFFKRPNWITPNFVVVSPLVIPLQRYAFVRAFNRKLLSLLLWRIKRKMAFDRPLLWTYNPLTTRLLDISAYRGVIYHCVDEIKEQPGMPVDILASAEEELTRLSDVVFVTAPKLYETRCQWNKNVWFFSNVADYNHFSQAQDTLLTIPDDISGIKRPILGFIGAISSYKLDFNLIERVAQAHPDFSFVFIGKVGEGDPDTRISSLQKCQNIHFLGPKSYNHLPAYLKAFDIALLPSLINSYTENMFPMKFYEYLAAGKPIIATRLPALSGQDEFTCFVDSPESFSNAVKALNITDSKAIKARQAEARKYTYEIRTKAMLDIIESQSLNR